MRVERLPGDAAIIDIHNARARVGGEFPDELVPRRPRGLVTVDQHARLGCGHRCARTRPGKNRLESLSANEMRYQATRLRAPGGDPRHGHVQAAFSDPIGLRVRGQDPLIDAKGHRRVDEGIDIARKPADITQTQRAGFGGPASHSPFGTVCKGEDLAGILQQAPPGLGEPDASPIPDEQVGTEITLQGQYLLRERRTGDVHALGGAAEVKLVSDGDKVPQLPQFHQLSLGRRSG